MTSPDRLSIRPMRDGEEDMVIDLWQKSGLTRAFNNPERDVALARKALPLIFLLVLKAR